jgi:hypothetical protein
MKKPRAGVRWPGWVRGLTLIMFLGVGAGASGAESLDLSGTWRYALDRADRGIEEHWQRQNCPAGCASQGSLSQQGVGDPISTNTPWVGGIVDRSWFTEDIWGALSAVGPGEDPVLVAAGDLLFGGPPGISERWKYRCLEGRRLVLFLERPHRETRVWWDDQFQGSADALGTPHTHELGVAIPGRHRLTVRVDNRLLLDVGQDSHSVSDHTQGNWNGIAGRLELQATPPGLD